MKNIKKSAKLDNVCYEIRGPVLKEAKRLEEEGYKVIKLNIGSPASFGLNAPDEIVRDMVLNIQNAQAYGDSRGLFAARKAVMQDFQSKNVMDVGIEDVFIGNGVSELISMSMQALLDAGDEILIPMPDYPLWTAASTLAGGKAVHYLCDEASDWNPDLNDIRSKITPKTKAIVVINPNNPTGAVYERSVLEGIAQIARENSLIIFSDEIYGRITYDEAVHIPMSTVAPDLLTITFDGLSKAWRAAGFRAGWMVLSGNKKIADDYVEGLDMLANMRLCPNMVSQMGIQTALGGYQSIKSLILPGGRLRDQRDAVYNLVTQIPGLSAVKPKGALYLFPKIDCKRFNITSDVKFMLDLVRAQRLLLVHGTGFNWNEPDHFRIVFLPDKDTLTDAMKRLNVFLESYKQS